MYRPTTNTLLKILATPFFWFLQACSPLGNPVDAEKSDNYYYNSSKSAIHYSPMGNWFELGNDKMNADVDSFKVLESGIGIDKNHIYFKGFPITNIKIDRETFSTRNEDYTGNLGFDKNHAFVFTEEYVNKSRFAIATIIQNADPKSYTVTDRNWSKDEKNHFYKNKKINVDFETFEPINDYFAKDSSTTYVFHKDDFHAFKSDLKTFKIFEGNGHGIDKTHVYWLPFFTEDALFPITIPYNRIDQVHYLNRYFLKIADTIYFDGTPRTDIDANSFEIVAHDYSKDCKHAYYEDKIIFNADVSTFRFTKEKGVIDKNGRYRDGKLIQE